VTAPLVERFADLEALSAAAATHVIRLARAAVAERGGCAIALSGGATPRRLLELLAGAGRAALPWDAVTLWWCDERAVPPDHPDSNFAMVRRALIDPLGLSPAQLHRMPGERAGSEPEARAAALEYQRELCAHLGEPPLLDLALLGMGKDGHTASLFPESPALDALAFPEHPWVVAHRVTSPLFGPDGASALRFTLTAQALAAARHTLVLAAGADKADALHAVLCGPPAPRRYPAQLLADSPRPVQWLIDEAAAARLAAQNPS
jgi:6-phosphogluconolactonase